jgi:adenylate kinase family enzyme
MVIQISGAPGSGKSTMAKLLRQSIGGFDINNSFFIQYILSRTISNTATSYSRPEQLCLFFLVPPGFNL